MSLIGCDREVESGFASISGGESAGMTTAGSTGQPDDPGTSTTAPDDDDGDASSDAASTDDNADESTESTDGDATTTGTSDGGGDPCEPNPCDATEVCVDGACEGMAAPQAGDLVITELQPNPDVVTDDAGEWFELLSVAATPLELGGCTLADLDSDSHTVAGSLVIPAGGVVVLARAAAGNGGLAPDYVYGNDLSLANGDDELSISCGGVVIDEVVYAGSWPFGAGAAAQLDPAAGASNDDPSQWCTATTAYGDGDLGSPGAPNDPC
ncbi:MAG: lamin tail domain-containing protein [Myxococcota bacterium]